MRFTPLQDCCSRAPIPIVAQIWQCVVKRGILRREPIIITVAELNLIIVSLLGVILHNLLPIALIIFLPYKTKLTEIHLIYIKRMI